MLETFGLTHTALPVSDLERSLRFYRALVGAEVRARGDDWADIGTPGCSDVISLQAAPKRANGDMGALGHIGFRLRRQEALQTIVDAVVGAGGNVDDSGHFTPDEPYVFTRDPDGYVIELWYEP
jgi:catechol 2,3-dioxygenase-like lactoylglutathione lyase family enzyme